MTVSMSPLVWIRRQVFCCTQAEFAAIAGVSPSQICRWERSTRDAGLPELARIRAAAISRLGIWDDSWFFVPPAHDDESVVARLRRSSPNRSAA